jgi:superfamily II helicase
MNSWDGKLLAICRVCGMPVRVEFFTLAQHGRDETEPICPTCSRVEEQVRQSISNQKETL